MACSIHTSMAAGCKACDNNYRLEREYQKKKEERFKRLEDRMQKLEEKVAQLVAKGKRS